jgi:hypothetical protein
MRGPHPPSTAKTSNTTPRHREEKHSIIPKILHVPAERLVAAGSQKRSLRLKPDASFFSGH